MASPSRLAESSRVCLLVFALASCTGAGHATFTMSGTADAPRRTEPVVAETEGAATSVAEAEVAPLPEGGFATGRILFVRRNAVTRGWSHGGDLWVLDASSGTSVRLTAGGDHQNPRWAPDGSTVVFEALSERASVSRLFTVRADGTSLRPLTGRDAIVETWPAWSPDGSSITFASHPRGRGQYELVRVRSDGSGSRALGLQNASKSVWSRDGRTLFFVSYANAPNAYTSKIFRVSSEGSRPQRLTQLPPDVSEDDPRLAPDGRTVAFRTQIYDPARHALDEGSAYTIRLDGSDLRDLNRLLDVAPRSPGLVPFWSPDMRRVAYVVEGGVLVTDEEATRRRVVGAGLGVAGDLAWSPDGRWVAFRGGWLEGRELYVADVDEELVFRVTTSGDVDGHMSGLEWHGPAAELPRVGGVVRP